MAHISPPTSSYTHLNSKFLSPKPSNKKGGGDINSKSLLEFDIEGNALAFLLHLSPFILNFISAMRQISHFYVSFFFFLQNLARIECFDERIVDVSAITYYLIVMLH